MSANTHGFQIGMTVYVEPYRGSSERVISADSLQEQVITKIGRRWIEIGYARFDPEHMRIDQKGYGWGSKVWTSRQEFEETTLRNRLWAELMRKLTPTSPPVKTAQEVMDIATLCGVSLSEKE